MNRIRQIVFPSPSLIEKSLTPTTFQDAYSVVFYSEQFIDPSDVMKAFFTNMHPLVLFAFLLREGLAKLMGLKTVNKKEISMELKRFSGNIGESIALIQVVNKSNEELLTGYSDKCFDFRLSFFSFRRQNETEIVVATCIKIKNNLGIIYLTIIMPFHKLMMPLVLKERRKKFLARNGR